MTICKLRRIPRLAYGSQSASSGPLASHGERMMSCFNNSEQAKDYHPTFLSFDLSHAEQTKNDDAFCKMDIT